MNRVQSARLVTFFGCLSLMLLVVPAPRTQALPQQQGMATVYCASDDWRRHYCPMDTGAGVQLWKQRSDTDCNFGRTWGYERRGVWVDKGCRGEFVPGNLGSGGGNNWQGWGKNYAVYCASDNGRRNRCPVDTSGGVRLVRKRSDASCNYSYSWGYDRHGIWVDRGCRADFEVGKVGWQPPMSQTVYCASDDGRRNSCRADTTRGVRIVRQRSDADCIYSRTWGYDRGGIWVDRGCRADFEVGLGK